MKQFDFGENWLRFSRKALTDQSANYARRDFISLLDGINLTNAWFLDVGFGQGLSMFCAAEQGAHVVGLDLNVKNLQALDITASQFPKVNRDRIMIRTGSILSKKVCSELREIQPEGYDVVHAWGVLHHTGNMAQALRICADLIRPGGYMIVSIYNHHWTSPLWKKLKEVYCFSPKTIKKIIIYSFAPLIWVAKLCVTKKWPSKKERGMDFFFDVVDWVGGYPYEYASIKEFSKLCQRENLVTVRVSPATVPTGCNEFVFRRESA